MFFSKRFCSFLASLAARLALAAALPRARAQRRDRLPGRLGELVLGQMGVPHLQRPHRRELPHRLPVGGDRRRGHRLRLGLGEAVAVRRHGHARREPLDVVLERPGQRLVEVVDVEDESSLRRAEHPEVRQVRVTAQLHIEPRRGAPVEVCRHDLRGAPVERERRCHHPAVPHRDQVGVAPGVLFLEQVDGVLPAGIRRPAGMTRRRNPVSGCLAPRGAFLQAQVLDLLQHCSARFLGPARARLARVMTERSTVAPCGQVP